ncbi:asparagine synthase-related protein [Streptomyces sp. NPDC002602]|uniref:asparagine synthase-related protein n=1 Tax=Streptomyces sp. NPDC002602 TaxID=3364654 RepID=UPI00369A413A
MRTGFVVVPDTAEAELASKSHPFVSPKVISHPSGRPWVVGNWHSGDVVSAQAGPVRVVVIGYCTVTNARLSDLAKRVRELVDVDRLTESLHGSFHLIVSVNGRTRVQGSLAGFRRVYHARLGDVPLVADRADALACMTAADIDEEALAVRVVCGAALPPPVSEQSMWVGVRAVPPDHYVAQEHHSARETRWWHPPAPDVPLENGALLVREALLAGTADRHPTHGRLSSDLSGGMDSTSLCFLAARSTSDLLTFRWAEAEAGNDDSSFAAHAAQSLPHAEHLVVPQSDLPDIFADHDSEADIEQPYLFSRTLARTRYSAQLLARHGARWHLAGHGADELFYKFPGYLHHLLRRHPVTAVRHLRAHRALSRWPLAATAGELLRSSSITRWWHDQADGITNAALPTRFPPLEWGFVPLRAPEWVSEEAVSATRAVLSRTAQTAQPLAPDRGQHQFLHALRSSGPAYAQLARVYAEAGVQLHVPYLDDRTVEAALSVRLHEPITPWQYKPLLAASMRGIVPYKILGRQTKGEFSEDVRVGLRRHLPAMLRMFDDSALADRGLINVDVLQRTLLAPQPDSSRHLALERLVGCETWLRGVTTMKSRRSADVRVPAW